MIPPLTAASPRSSWSNPGLAAGGAQVAALIRLNGTNSKGKLNLEFSPCEKWFKV